MFIYNEELNYMKYCLEADHLRDKFIEQFDFILGHKSIHNSVKKRYIEDVSKLEATTQKVINNKELIDKLEFVLMKLIASYLHKIDDYKEKIENCKEEIDREKMNQLKSMIENNNDFDVRIENEIISMNELDTIKYFIVFTLTTKMIMKENSVPLNTGADWLNYSKEYIKYKGA